MQWGVAPHCRFNVVIIVVNYDYGYLLFKVWWTVEDFKLFIIWNTKIMKCQVVVKIQWTSCYKVARDMISLTLNKLRDPFQAYE